MRRLIFVVAMLAACGGSGVDGDKLVVELSETEIDDLCSYIVEEQGGARSVVCMDDEGEYTVEFPDVDECIDDMLSYSEECGATVRQEEECAEKLGDDPCDDPAACHASDDC